MDERLELGRLMDETAQDTQEELSSLEQMAAEISRVPADKRAQLINNLRGVVQGVLIAEGLKDSKTA